MATRYIVCFALFSAFFILIIIEQFIKGRLAIGLLFMAGLTSFRAWLVSLWGSFILRNLSRMDYPSTKQHLKTDRNYDFLYVLLFIASSLASYFRENDQRLAAIFGLATAAAMMLTIIDIWTARVFERHHFKRRPRGL